MISRKGRYGLSTGAMCRKNSLRDELTKTKDKRKHRREKQIASNIVLVTSRPWHYRYHVRESVRIGCFQFRAKSEGTGIGIYDAFDPFLYFGWLVGVGLETRGCGGCFICSGWFGFQSGNIHAQLPDEPVCLDEPCNRGHHQSAVCSDRGLVPLASFQKEVQQKEISFVK